EKLTFDHQIDLAKRLNYADSSGQRGVERFMQDFFRHATTVGDLTRIFLTALEAEHVKPRPTFKQRVVNLFGVRSNEPAPEGYQIENGRLNVSDPERFLDDPINILRIFEEALHSEVLIHPNTMRVIAANLNLITDQVRSDETAQKLFLGLLLDHGNPERALRRMNELGVLGQFIPEFERIIAMMQFNFYHHFTVDEHTIQCVAYLAKLESGQLSDTFPIVSRILKKGLNRRILYVALLVHDIGKGLPTAHEVIGEEMARDIAPRLSLDEEETETVAWLVRNHLEMSDMAQKRDISDPKTVRDFARSVQSIRRLNLLTALTVCDILGVGPGTLTPWKAELLRQLYTATRHFLREGSVDGAVEESVSAKKSALAALLENWEPKAKDHELSRHYAEYWMGLDTATQLQIAEGLRRVTPSEIEVSTAKDEQREATRICFVLQDHPGIFSRLAGALGLAGMNVIEARTYTTSDGYATAVFWIHNQIGQVIEDEARLNRLKETFKKTLSGEVIARRAIVEKDKIAKRERDMLVSTEITFDNEGSDVFTIIEVDTRDRPGLLYDLTRTLADSNIRISSASVTTYGAQAVDTFYVKDIFGLKIQSSQKQATVAAKLEAAIHAGAERALAQ
ncbi:MAG: [protein-PII] uridylyltransferase, partial [Pseudomonadota bacterium]